MLEYIRGRVEERGLDWVVVDLHGMGLRVNVPTSTATNLPAAGDDLKLWTHLYVREDMRAVYGFSSVGERALFVQLLGVGGVGPRVALAALSMLNADRLAAAIESGDEATLARIPGVGKKTASRMVLDLKGKVQAGLTDGAPAAGDGAVMDALLSMQLTRAEAAAALASLPLDPNRSEEETMRRALQAYYARGAR